MGHCFDKALAHQQKVMSIVDVAIIQEILGVVLPLLQGGNVGHLEHFVTLWELEIGICWYQFWPAWPLLSLKFLLIVPFQQKKTLLLPKMKEEHKV